ncbi:MAG: hypothetical protein R3245_11975 [Kiloniellales bacterium]|nr:hypothetical protein [Kiloniellales bacterium]
MVSVSLILFPKFQMLAYVLATETLRIANKVAGQRVFEWETRCATGSAITASNGALVAPQRDNWTGAETYDLLLLCAASAARPRVSATR